jgi:hypothetical protein
MYKERKSSMCAENNFIDIPPVRQMLSQSRMQTGLIAVAGGNKTMVPRHDGVLIKDCPDVMPSVE